ncbi:hypothetical protein NBRC116601_34570 [Cognatishimia sp. WU-CL00825]|uniref:glyoxalase n=1 Tax=Cognatishimia sp. WU-CL00825 TaxID=3127658 RepID=UPI003101F790
MGLHTGPRPNFPFPGAWLYAGDAAVIHLVGHGGDPADGSEVKLKLEHFALTATGKADFEAKLSHRAVSHQRFELDEIGVVQFHLRSPDGNHVYIDFISQE